MFFSRQNKRKQEGKYHMQIEKLRRYKTSDDGCYWYNKPTGDDIIDKINEIIDYINTTESVCADILKKAQEQTYGNQV